jgi:hypothetical protein
MTAVASEHLNSRLSKTQTLHFKICKVKILNVVYMNKGRMSIDGISEHEAEAEI